MSRNKETRTLIVKALSEATGLKWSPPPASPCAVQNGYFVETEWLRAPHLVRQLKEAANEATGRPRAIIYERSSPKNAAVNIPREIAEDEAFLDALADVTIKASKAVKDQRRFTLPAPQAAQALQTCPQMLPPQAQA